MAAVHSKIEEHLFRLGYQRTKYRLSLEDFGSLYSVYETRDRIVRFIWDGKEGGLTFRIYGRRNWGMKLARALIGGTAGDERLQKEVLVRRNEVAVLSEEELQDKLLQALNGG